MNLAPRHINIKDMQSLLIAASFLSIGIVSLIVYWIAEGRKKNHHTPRLFTLPEKKAEKTPKERLEAIGFSLDEVEDHLCCEISGEIMNRPVFFRTAGHTYDHESIMRCVRENIPFTDLNRKFTEAELDLTDDTGCAKKIEAFVTEKEREHKNKLRARS